MTRRGSYKARTCTVFDIDLRPDRSVIIRRT